MTLRRFVLPLLLIALAEAPARAQEQADAAAELFRAGTAAHERGDHRAAAVAFEQANHLAPRAATLLNAALSRDAAGDKPRAADELAGALRLPGLTSAQSAAVKSRLGELRRALALLHLDGPEGLRASVGYVQDAPLPLDVHLSPGEVTLRLVRPDGSISTERVTVLAGEEKRLTFEARAVPAAVLSAPTTEKTPAVHEEPRPPPVASGLTPRQRWSLLSFGAALASAGAATITGLTALSAKSDFEKSAYTDVGSHDRASTYRTATNVAWVASGAFAAVGVAVLLWPSATPTRARSGARVELHVAPQRVACVARW